MILELAMLQASITSTEVKLCAAFSAQSRQRLLAAASLMAVSVWFTHNNTLMLKGIEELVCRVRPCPFVHAVLGITYYGVAEISAKSASSSPPPPHFTLK